MPDLSSITLPNNVTYDFKDETSRRQILELSSSIPAQASIDSNGLITFKNSSNTALFTLQLPLYNGGVS